MPTPLSSLEFKYNDMEKLTRLSMHERQTSFSTRLWHDYVSNYLNPHGTQFTSLCYKAQSSVEAYGLSCILSLPVIYITTVHTFFIWSIQYWTFFRELGPVRRHPVLRHFRSLTKKKSEFTTRLFYIISSHTEIWHTCHQLYVLIFCMLRYQLSKSQRISCLSL